MRAVAYERRQPPSSTWLGPGSELGPGLGVGGYTTHGSNPGLAGSQAGVLLTRVRLALGSRVWASAPVLCEWLSGEIKPGDAVLELGSEP